MVRELNGVAAAFTATSRPAEVLDEATGEYRPGQILQRDSLYPPYETDCTGFTPWEKNEAVCSSCGSAYARHLLTDNARPTRKRELTGFVRDYWAWMLRHGGVPNYYGTYDQVQSAQILQHLLAGCRLSDQVTEPSLGEVDEFAGTFADHNNQVDAVVGTLTCACGQVDNVTWCVKHDGLTVGEVIYQVVNGR